MPTFDGGHCFLTVLLPIKTDEVIAQDGLHNSPVELVRAALEVLPTAHQSPVTVDIKFDSPFAKCTKTHFTRFAVLDNVIFNGRMPSSIFDQAPDLTVPLPVDQLPCPYLMWVTDFDAPQGTQEELRDYLRGVWTKMAADLKPVFSQCFGYDQRCANADGFADYIVSCQLETTMPFNDYWPPGPIPLPSISVNMLILIALAVLIVVGGGLYGIFSALGWLWTTSFPWLFCLQYIFFFVVAAGAAAYTAYRIVMARGAKPFPMAPNSDLPSVLKALYLQRKLIAFVIAAQGKSNQQLFGDFGTFLDQVRVGDTSAPTQPPGVIGA